MLTAEINRNHPQSPMKKSAPAPASPTTAKITPMMAQYIEIKAANPDSLLFYRMGDFFELFFDDAVAASEALDIALTKRGKHNGADIPMCGVPARAADRYLQILIRKGFRVAVCEQTEDPAEAKKRGGKAVVRRDVTRLVTRGTLTEDALLETRTHNFLAALGFSKASGGVELALAWTDISTGEMFCAPSSAATLSADLARIEPGELLVPEHLPVTGDVAGLEQTLSAQTGVIAPLSAASFDSANGERRLKAIFGVAALEGFGAFSRAELGALGAVVGYIELTQIGKLPALAPPRRLDPSASMAIDSATRASLELVRTLGGARQGSLLDILDRTVTGAGSRALADRLLAPSTEPQIINQRLDAVAHLAESTALRETLRADLKAVPDLARALSRLSLGRGGPRDLGVVRDALRAALDLPDLFARFPGLAPLPSDLGRPVAVLAAGPRALQTRLKETLGEELPHLVRDGGFVAPGHVAELDEARALRDESRRVIAAMETELRGQTQIKSLKIRHNNVLGYFIEVTAQHGATLLSQPETFIHRQTMANAVRFTTATLAGLEARIGEAAAQAQAIEEQVFAQLAQAVVDEATALSAITNAVALLDVAAALADLAQAERYTRPSIAAHPVFRVTGGRHPVVERALAAAQETRFVTNDCDLSAKTQERGGTPERGGIWLVTGPNMSGKSTFLRQNALIAVMAQMGSFVPAESAEIGVVDRLFSRVGASDDLAGGRSTFMVEMVETAAILNQATANSLVILDEIGRGTATFDGLAIAWATLEHLHEVNRCRTLFATHFHELTALSEKHEHLANVTVAVKEWQGDVVFLHEVVPGAADRSYGVQVARLAGLPGAVTARADEVLAALEASETGARTKTLIDDLPLFSVPAARSTAREPTPHKLLEKLTEILPDELTPREAHDVLYQLKALVEEGE